MVGQIKAAFAIKFRTIHNGADLRETEIRPLALELAIPWRTIGETARAGNVISYDFVWTDVDRDGDEMVAGSLRWAGGARNAGYLSVVPDQAIEAPWDPPQAVRLCGNARMVSYGGR